MKAFGKYMFTGLKGLYLSTSVGCNGKETFKM
jgi:hypothetical protein